MNMETIFLYEKIAHNKLSECENQELYMMGINLSVYMFNSIFRIPEVLSGDLSLTIRLNRQYKIKGKQRETTHAACEK